MKQAYKSSISALLGFLVFFASPSITTIAAGAASQPKLILNEVHWAGNISNPADQWVEIFNPSNTEVDLSVTPYRVALNATQIAVLDTGTIAPLGYYLMSALNPAQPSSNSSLRSDIVTTVVPSLTTLQQNTQISLVEIASGYSDVANLTTGLPFAGSSSTVDGAMISSQIRQPSPSGYYAPGDTAGAWMSSTTFGANFKPGSQQLGTPTGQGMVATDPLFANPEIGVPITAGVTNSVTNARPYVNAVFREPADRLVVTFTHAITGVVTEAVAQLPLGYQPATPLVPGFYTVKVKAVDAYGNSSQEVIVPIHDQPINQYLVLPREGFITPPTLQAVPSPTKATSEIVRGSVQPGTSAVRYTINGSAPSTISLATGVTTFSFPVNLTLDATTTVAVTAVAQDESESAPSTLTINQDATAPAALNSRNVRVSGNVEGFEDVVQGLAGAGEAGATVKLYADSNLLTLLGTGTLLSDGSFAQISIGDDLSQTIYAVLVDEAGNVSEPTVLSNPKIFFALTTIPQSPTENPATQPGSPIVGTPIPVTVPTATPVAAATVAPTATPTPSTTASPVATPTPTTTPAGASPAPLENTTPANESVVTANSAAVESVVSPTPTADASAESGDVLGATTSSESSWLRANAWWIVLVAAGLLWWFFMYKRRNNDETDRSNA